MTTSNDSMSLRPWTPLLAMGVSALLAIWLLWHPELISNLPMILRLPLIALGVWALGSGFMQGMRLTARPGWLRRLLGPPASWYVLALFTLVLLARAWWLS
ncbi:MULTISPECIES: hypothetical protein [Halomonadaceae]|uniref:hypothetical protein n=1 Tax=Halomonadaceae TaxID=28256 RepID=UPI00159A838B|nr:MULTISPECIES: hypothetical protein [Halomonas]QJQ95296.1 hypothetical protein HIO72_08430 [Halomonas sp. PA5]